MSTYALLVAPNANRVYGHSAPALMQTEFEVIDLQVLGGKVRGLSERSIAGIPYVVFSADSLSAGDIANVSNLSSVHALFELRGETRDFQWWLASDRGLRQLLHVGGFRVEQTSRFFLLRPGPAGTGGGSEAAPRRSVMRALNWLLTRDATPGGHLHRAYLARPRF